MYGEFLHIIFYCFFEVGDIPLALILIVLSVPPQQNTHTVFYNTQYWMTEKSHAECNDNNKKKQNWNVLYSKECLLSVSHLFKYYIQ